jgi:hypothetical protein
VVLWIAAALASLFAAGFGLILLLLTPNPGMEALVAILKVVFVAGWVGIAAWQFLQLFGRRWRFVVAPAASWIWLSVMATILGRVAFLNWGP